MISEIVGAALSSSNISDHQSWHFVDHALALNLASAARSSRIAFPVYKPRCDDRALLSDHTAMLCEGFAWSEPLFHVIISGYVATKGAWSPRNDSDLIGRTICQPAGEVAPYLRERGLTDLNARIVTARSPAACLRQVADGESDIAIMPMVSAETAIGGSGLGKIVRHVNVLDQALGMHAIARLDRVDAIEQIIAFDAGLANIRDSGAWFEIVKAHHKDHRRDTLRNARSSD